jgi:hypothetical protein
MDDPGTTSEPTPVAPDPFDRIYHVVVTGNKLEKEDYTLLPPTAYKQKAHWFLPPRQYLAPLSRIQRELALQLAKADAKTEAEVIITFAENLPLPSFPSRNWYLKPPTPPLPTPAEGEAVAAEGEAVAPAGEAPAAAAPAWEGAAAHLAPAAGDAVAIAADLPKPKLSPPPPQSSADEPQGRAPDTPPPPAGHSEDKAPTQKTEPQQSEQSSNQRSLDADWLQSLYDKRAGDYQTLTDQLRPFNAVVLSGYGLIRALRVRVPLRRVRALVRGVPDVRYVELQRAGEPPPTGIDVVTRDTITDHDSTRGAGDYIGLYQSPVRSAAIGRIALLDTGFPSTTDESIKSLTKVTRQFECMGIPGPPDQAHPCQLQASAGRGALTTAPDNHGLLTTVVLTAVNLDTDYKGLTSLPVDAFAVYARKADNTIELDADAAVRAFETIVADPDYSVVVASIQGKRLAHSAISAAADRAFDAGLVVIAANGNTAESSREDVGEDQPWWTTSPANGHKVMGVGAIDITGQWGADAQSYDIDDGRIKPDVQGPTFYRVLPPAPPALPGAQYQLLETSGATPIVGAAAALLSAWLAGLDTPTLDAGQVYAQLILAGQNCEFGDNEGHDGTGRLYLPGDGEQWWGKLAVSAGDAVTITLDVPANVDRMDAACWWPESATLGPEDDPVHAPHNQITLQLVAPDGRTDTSWWPTSVFQRVQLPTGDVSGSWRLIITGEDVSDDKSQTVYWAAYGRAAGA